MKYITKYITNHNTNRYLKMKIRTFTEIVSYLNELKAAKKKKEKWKEVAEKWATERAIKNNVDICNESEAEEGQE